MSEITVVISPVFINKINELTMNKLVWSFPKQLPNPMITTNTSSPWWHRGGLFENVCSVSEGFIQTMDAEKIEYLTEEAYYEKISHK